MENFDERIQQLKTQVDKYREIIKGVNDDIEREGFEPSKPQQNEIDYICNQGKSTLAEIERLEKLKNK